MNEVSAAQNIAWLASVGRQYMSLRENNIVDGDVIDAILGVAGDKTQEAAAAIQILVEENT